jgi:hypothetical protein
LSRLTLDSEILVGSKRVLLSAGPVNVSQHSRDDRDGEDVVAEEEGGSGGVRQRPGSRSREENEGESCSRVGEESDTGNSASLDVEPPEEVGKEGEKGGEGGESQHMLSLEILPSLSCPLIRPPVHHSKKHREGRYMDLREFGLIDLPEGSSSSLVDVVGVVSDSVVLLDLVVVLEGVGHLEQRGERRRKEGVRVLSEM